MFSFLLLYLKILCEASISNKRTKGVWMGFELCSLKVGEGFLRGGGDLSQISSLYSFWWCEIERVYAKCWMPLRLVGHMEVIQRERERIKQKKILIMHKTKNSYLEIVFIVWIGGCNDQRGSWTSLPCVCIRFLIMHQISLGLRN